MGSGDDAVRIGTTLTWIAFAGGISLACTLGVLLRDRPRLQSWAWALVGFLPFFQPLDIGLIFDPDYLGDSHGVEVAMIDALALSLFIAQPRSPRHLPYRLPLLIYLAAAAFSVTQAMLPMHAAFYVWKLLRMYFLFAVLARAADRQQVVTSVLVGMMVGTLYEFVLVLEQRFVMYQSPGSFSHQNSLGMALVLVLMPPIAIALGRRMSWLVAIVPAAGLVTTVLTRSRGAIIFFALGAAVVYLLSLMRAVHLRKLAVGLLGIIIASAVWVKTSSAIIERFESAPEESLETRAQYERAAALMLDEHPEGIGANHFTSMLINAGYGERAGVVYDRDLRAIVHNIYRLTAAELGYFGGFALVVLFAVPIAGALRYSFRAREEIRGDILLGLGVGLGMCCLHGLYEWVWRSTEISYLYWMMMALAGTLSMQIKEAAADPKPGTAHLERETRAAGGTPAKW